MLILTTMLGCGQNSFVATPSVTPNIAEDISVAPVPSPGPKNEEFAICSNLSLMGVSWPSPLDTNERRAMALGLNISGSFEGHNGWKNLTNNFDGQGLSLGLLNQCLGQGSLQPLLIKMRDQHLPAMRDIFSALHFTALTSMLAKWQGAVKVSSLSEFETEDLPNDDGVRPDGRLSDIDQLPDGTEGVAHQESVSADSVTWAKVNLYTDGGTTFVSKWKQELQSMSADASYVSIQIAAALKTHTKAVGYMKTLGLHELRSYLFLFDVNVQNGGLYSADLSAYQAAFPDGSFANETSRLKSILALRLSHVIAKYKSDVQARKLSIINGTGTVHGSARNYAKEFCFNALETVL